MTSKHKSSRKRGSDHFGDTISRVTHAADIFNSRSKKRKNGNGEILNYGNGETIDAQSQSHCQATIDGSQQKYANKYLYAEKGKKILPAIGGSSKEKYPRSRYKKTYACLSKIKLSPNQLKNKQNIAANNALHNTVHINTNKSVDYKITVGDNVGKKKKELIPHSSDLLPSGSNTNGNGCLIYVQSPSLTDERAQGTIAEEDCSSLIEQHQLVDVECSKDKCIKTGSLISTNLIPFASPSHNSVFKSVDKVTGISTTISMPTLNVNTSPITAISTPIPTISKLPDVLRDVSKGEGISHGQRTLTLLNTSQQRDHPLPGSSFEKERSKQFHVFPESCNVTIHDNQPTVFPFKCGETQPGIPFPTPDIIIEDVKEENTESLEDNKSDITINLHSSETMNTNSTPSSFLQVDKWAAHMLQNLELLYKNEKYCDLILKFSGGEVLKVHRTILSACTSLLSGSDTMQDENELVVPADLSYASVEPLIKFIYSGRLEIQKSASEIRGIYSAAKRLKLSLLTHIMELHFPYLSSSSSLCVESSTSLGDSKRHRKQTLTKSNSSTTVLASQSSIQGSTSCKTVTTKTTTMTSSEANGQDNDTKSFKDHYDMKIEEFEGENASVYYLVTNSRNSPLSTGPVSRCLKATEEARPTRFELKEESENSSEVVIWSSAPSTPSHKLPSVPPTISSNHPPVYSSGSLSGTSSETCSYTQSSPSQTFKKHPFVVDGKVAKKQPHITSQASQREQMTGSGDSDLNVSCESSDDVTENNQNRKNESKEKNVDLMEKISSICRQLEEREVSDVNINDTNFREEKDDDKSPSSCSKNKASGKEESSHVPNTLTPVKSILKKKKNKISVKKEPKHVSFQLDENNELINEVATFSLSKEPAQSLIDVQKTKGTYKSLNNTPMKLTASMKKKVLMNLSLSESETIGSSSLQSKKSHGKKGGNSSNQSHSKNHINKGDISSHAKLISEVLKKYPHLVKDKKKIGLKILKKENENEGGGKAKSKVQYLLLSDAKCDSKSKSPAKSYKASSWTKHGPSISQTVHTFECPECNNKIFKTYFMLKKHVLSEHKDKSSAILSHIENVPYACYTCFVNEPLEFANYYSYQQHMKDIHSKTELRLCNICGFRPGRKLELAYHQYTEHNKISRSFCFPKCDLCDHVAINDHALLKHRSQHTNADNYTCSVCGVKFCSFGALQGHMQTKLCQTKPSVSYKCPHCPRTFTRSYNLKAHCRSSHKSLQTSTLIGSGAIKKPAETLTSHNSESQSEEIRGENSAMQTASTSENERNHIVNPEVEHESLIADIQPSSEAEALSTVANSLVTSLRLPEENVNNYVYSQDHNINYSNTNSGKSGEDSLHLVNDTVELEIPSLSQHQSQPPCYDKSYSVQASIQDSTNMGTLYPISVVSSEVLPSHIIPGQIFSSPILPTGCVNTPNGPVLGAASQSWTYVTYQVPSTSEDTSLVFTETASINVSQNSRRSTSTENVNHTTTTMTTKENMELLTSDDRCIENTTSIHQEVTPVTVTDADMNTNVNPISLPEAHTYHTLSSSPLV